VLRRDRQSAGVAGAMRPTPAEPTTLRAELRAIAGEDVNHAHRQIAAALGEYLGIAWELGKQERKMLDAALGRARYEAFLWVMGDRRWVQLVETLGGRLRRLCERLDAAGSTREAVGGA
jgi:hypothetical protein